MKDDYKFKLGLALARERQLIQRLEAYEKAVLIALEPVEAVKGMALRFSTQEAATRFVRLSDYDRLRDAVKGALGAQEAKD